MGKSTAFSADLVKLIFNGTTTTTAIAQNAASPLLSLFLSLHTADPNVTAGSGTLGTQNASEATYTGYSRVSVTRTSAGFSCSAGGVVSPVAPVSFPLGSGGSGTVSFFGIGSALSSTGELYYSGTVTPNIVSGNGVTPVLTAASTVQET